MPVGNQSLCSVGVKSLIDQLSAIDHALTATELAKLLALDQTTIYKLATSGRLPSFKVGGAVRFDPGALGAWLRSKGVL
jgi:excisionase family DNA binding protein